jgi:hypothetical protein
MKYSAILLALVIGAFAASAEDLTAKVVAIKKYDNGRVNFWEGYTPVYDGRPVYDITIQFGEKPYIVRYESGSGYYPAAWAVGSDIRVTKQRGRFLLMNRDEAVPARIVSDHDCIPQPTRNASLPQLPC